MTKLEHAVEIADTDLDTRNFGWTLARGRVKPEEPLWGFQIIRLYAGLDSADDPPLVVSEHADPYCCVKDAMARLEVLNEWIAEPLPAPRGFKFRVLHRTKWHDQPYFVEGDSSKWIVLDSNQQPTIVVDSAAWKEAMDAVGRWLTGKAEFLSSATP